MRVTAVVALAFAASFMIATWWSNSVDAQARLNGAVSMDPIAMTLTSPAMPAQQYAAF